MVIWQDVQKTLGRTLTPAQQQQAGVWIEQARLLINNRALRAGTTIEQLDDATVDMVVTEAVADRFRKPDDATQVTIQADDTQVSRRYESSTGQIRIRDEWWDLLLPDLGSDAGSVSLAYTPDSGHLPIYRNDGSRAWMPHHDR